MQNTFRFKSFSAGQEQIVRRVLLNKSTIGLLPTGGGKSLTYQLAGLTQLGITVIVDPINSLMKDQESKLHQFGINQSAYVNTMLGQDEMSDRLENISLSKYLFIFLSPERFQIKKFRNAFRSARKNDAYFHYVVIDEAHVISEWGHDFRPSYLHLPHTIHRLFKKNLHGEDQRPAFIGLTATASFDVLADIQRELSVDEDNPMDEDSISTIPSQAIEREEQSPTLLDPTQVTSITGRLPLSELFILPPFRVWRSALSSAPRSPMCLSVY